MLPLSRFRTRRAAVTLYFNQQYYDCVTSGRDSCSFHSLSSFACNCVHTHTLHPPQKKVCSDKTHTHTHTRVNTHTDGHRNCYTRVGEGRRFARWPAADPVLLFTDLESAAAAHTQHTHTHTQPTPVSVDRIRATHARHCFAGFWVRSWLPHTDR